MLRQIWRWLRQERWYPVWEEEIAGYDNPNPFGYQAPIYRPTGCRVWKRTFSRLGYLVLGTIVLLFVIQFPLAFLRPELYQQLIVRFWEGVNVEGVWLLVTALIAGLIVLFLWLAAMDEVGITSYRQPERD